MCFRLHFSYNTVLRRSNFFLLQNGDTEVLYLPEYKLQIWAIILSESRIEKRLFLNIYLPGRQMFNEIQGRIAQ